MMVKRVVGRQDQEQGEANLTWLEAVGRKEAVDAGRAMERSQGFSEKERKRGREGVAGRVCSVVCVRERGCVCVCVSVLSGSE